MAAQDTKPKMRSRDVNQLGKLIVGISIGDGERHDRHGPLVDGALVIC